MVDFSNITRVFNSSLTSAGAGQQVRTGDFVFVKVLDKLPDSAWKVSIGGKLYPAVSDLALKPGDLLSARVQWQGDRLLLQLPGRQPDAVTVFLNRHGLPVNGLTQALVNSFIRNGQAVDPSAIEAARKILSRAKGPVIRNARFLAVLSAKGLSWTPPPGTDIVNEFFGSGQYYGGEPGEDLSGGTGGQPGSNSPGSGSDPREESKEDPGADAIEQTVRARDDEPKTLLHLFNHIREDSMHWIAVPFRFSADGAEWEGLIRILMDDTARKPVTLSVSVSDGSSEWSFNLKDKDGKKVLSLYALDERERKRAERLLPELESLVGRMGIDVAGSVADSRGFDGFSSDTDENGFRGIDLSL